MSQTVIEIRNLSKMYRLGEVGTGTLSHDLNRWWHKVRGKEDPFLKLGQENKRDAAGGDYVWALKDVNFDVKQGEVLGIIGKNGAGKSTLLKLLSRVTAPTTGSFKAKGRIASLLEVGTGFHPDLTGRENVFLNGAILGMNKNEIKRKFDEIVDFAGVERYIDTPVKRYSSGMYVRLAFAVAAHMESEILIVDEVLAVGDTEFQSKCLGKMNEVSNKEGRTVLFVSHQMGTIAQLCRNTVLLARGKIIEIGKTEKIIEKYLLSGGVVSSYKNLSEEKLIYFSKIETENEKGEFANQFSFEESIYVSCVIELKTKSMGEQVSFTIQDKLGYYISTDVIELSDLPGDEKQKIFKIKIPSSILAPNSYAFRLAVFKVGVNVYDLVENICPVTIVDTGSKMAKFEGVNYGHTILNFEIIS